MDICKCWRFGAYVGAVGVGGGGLSAGWLMCGT